MIYSSVNNLYNLSFSRLTDGEWVDHEITCIPLAAAHKYYDALYIVCDLELRAGNPRPYKNIRMAVNRDPLCDI